MKNRVPVVRQMQSAPNYPLQPQRTGKIHLVPRPAAALPEIAVKPVSKPNVAYISAPKSESEGLSTPALAGAALIAPLTWMGHALLVWLKVL